MQVSISVRHGRLSEASQEKIKAKVGKLDRHLERLTMIEVTVDLNNESKPTVQIQVSAEHKHDFVASDTSESLKGSLDAAIHKVDQQIRKYKEKLVERSRQSGQKQQEVPLESEVDEG